MEREDLKYLSSRISSKVYYRSLKVSMILTSKKALLHYTYTNIKEKNSPYFYLVKILQKKRWHMRRYILLTQKLS